MLAKAQDHGIVVNGVGHVCSMGVGFNGCGVQWVWGVGGCMSDVRHRVHWKLF